jgi:hypothetical protein
MTTTIATTDRHRSEVAGPLFIDARALETDLRAKVRC